MEIFVVDMQDVAEWGHGYVDCLDCVPGAEKRLATVENNPDFTAMTEAQLGYLRTVAEVHNGTTGHEVSIHTFSRVDP